MIRKLSSLMLTGLVVLAACGSDDSTESTSSAAPATDAAPATTASGGDSVSLTVALPVGICLATWPFHAAVTEGHFAAEGLDVTVEGLDGSSAAIQATLAGRAELAVTAPADMLAASGAGADVVGWYSVYQYLPFNIVTLADSGITDLAQLEGMTIGINSPSDGGAIFMRSLLSQAGIEEGSYEELSVGEGESAAMALKDGVVDAYSASFVEELVFGGMGIDFVQLKSDSYPAVAGLVIMSDTGWYESNPTIVEGFGRALAKATAWGLEDRAGIEGVCTKVAPEETQDPGFATVVLDAVDPLFTPLASASGKHGFVDEAQFAAYRDLLVELEVVEAPAAETQVSNVHLDAWNQG
jgi:NitT/TauT family transport system substrate-binding protein